MKLKIVLYFCLIAAAAAVNTTAYAQARLDLGTAAPVLAGRSLSGADVSLESYRGRWVYLDFWASWCQPCMSELDSIVQLQSQYGGQGKLEVVSVSLDNLQTFEALGFAISKFGVNYPVIYDGETANREIAADWGVSTIPATFLLDPNGVIAARDITPRDIPSFVQFDREQPYLPMQVSSSEQLMLNSPTSGWKTMRDLRISLDMSRGGPPVSYYQLFVTAACESGGGQSQYYDVRYDLHIQRGLAGDFPYSVEITKTSGDSYVNRGPGQPAAPADQPLPEMTVAIDEDRQSYEFIVPVPACSIDLGYAIALYDERLGRYVRNGLNRVETGFAVGGY